jgi:hypothetical protein
MNLGVLYRICNLSSAALEYLRKRYLCISKLLKMSTKNIDYWRLWSNWNRVPFIKKIYGTENVIASDIRKLNNDVVNSGPLK